MKASSPAAVPPESASACRIVLSNTASTLRHWRLETGSRSELMGLTIRDTRRIGAGPFAGGEGLPWSILAHAQRTIKTRGFAVDTGAARRPRAAAPRVRCSGSAGGQPQETEGQFQLPLCWMVTPKLLPLPLGVAIILVAVGHVALQFQVALILTGSGTSMTTLQSLEPETETLRL